MYQTDMLKWKGRWPLLRVVLFYRRFYCSIWQTCPQVVVHDNFFSYSCHMCHFLFQDFIHSAVTRIVNVVIFMAYSSQYTVIYKCMDKPRAQNYRKKLPFHRKCYKKFYLSAQISTFLTGKLRFLALIEVQKGTFPTDNLPPIFASPPHFLPLPERQ